MNKCRPNIKNEQTKGRNKKRFGVLVARKVVSLLMFKMDITLPELFLGEINISDRNNHAGC